MSLVFLFIAGLLAPAVAASPHVLPAGILATINGTMLAANAHDPARMNSYFTSNSTVTDEFPPYFWSAPNAGAAWWRAVDAYGKQLHATHMHFADGHITYWDLNSNSAYVVVPLRITGVTNGKAFVQTGLWALTLRRHAGVWLIERAAWAAQSLT